MHSDKKVPPTVPLNTVEGVESGPGQGTFPHGAGEEVRTPDPELGKNTPGLPGDFAPHAMDAEREPGTIGYRVKCKCGWSTTASFIRIGRIAFEAHARIAMTAGQDSNLLPGVGRANAPAAAPDDSWRVSELLKARDRASAHLDVAANSAARLASAYVAAHEASPGGNIEHPEVRAGMNRAASAYGALALAVEDFRRADAAHTAALRALQNHATGGGR